MPDEAKTQAHKEMENHLTRVTKERSLLRGIIEDSRRHLPEGMELGRHQPNSFDGTVHYSFDFAQQLQFPSNPLQPGPIYFKVPRKCGLFGVNCEALLQQMNYLIDESVCVGKGADCVISLLHHFLEHFGLGEKHLHMHADNCSGQNKNSAMLQYLLWRVMTGRHTSVCLSFLITGHTKFAPDGGFGLIKRLYRKTEVNSLAELSSCVTKSAKMNQVQLCGNEAGEVFVQSFQWTQYLARYFKKLTGILKYQHFNFFDDGTVLVREASDSEEIGFKLLKKTVKLPLPVDTLPLPKFPAGLSAERKKYLFNDIRPFVSDAWKDIVTPEPVQDPAVIAGATNNTLL